MMATADQTFPRAHRLSGNLAFAAVYDKRVKTSRGPLSMYSLPNKLPHHRLGLSISRRVGSAPVRNRIKRLLREAFRLHARDAEKGYDLVIVVRQHLPLKLIEYQRFMAEMFRKSQQSWIG